MPALGSGYGTRPASVKPQRNRRKPTQQARRRAQIPAATIPIVGQIVRAPIRAAGGRTSNSLLTYERAHRGETRAEAQQRRIAGRKADRQATVRSSLAAERAYLSQAAQLQRAASEQRQTAAYTRQIRRAGFGGARDLQVPAAIAQRAYERESQRRGFGSAADYYRRDPAAARSTLVPGRDVAVRGRDVGLKGSSASRVLSPLEAATVMATPLAALHVRQDLARIIGSEGVEAARAHQAQRKAANIAPVVNVLEQIQRPAYASAGAARAAVKGQNVLRGAARGALLKDRYLYSDVLAAAGVHNKLVRSIAGFGLDVALDPSTYLTLGATKVATKATAVAVEKVAKEAAARAALDLKPLVESGELSARRARQQIKAAGRDAGKQVLHRELSTGAHKGRGIEVRVAGARVPGVTRATAAVGRGGKRAVRTVTPAPVRRAAQRRALAARDVAAAVNPTVRPPTMTSEQFARTRQIARAERGEGESIGRRGAQRAVVIQKLTRPSEWRQIRDAIEHGDIESLKGIAEPIRVPKRMAVNKRARALARDPDRLYRFAQNLTEDWSGLRQQLVDLGVPVGYVGRKPPVQVPEVTADVGAARRELQQVRGARQRAEIEQVERMPAQGPDPVTPTQRAHARTKAQQARDRYRQSRDEHAHSKQQAANTRQEYNRRTEDPQFTVKSWEPQRRALAERVVEHEADARAARRQMNAAQADLRHWVQIARRPGSRTAAGEAGRHQAQEAAAIQRLRSVKTQAARQRKAQRVAQTRAEVQAREAKGYVPRFSREAVRGRGRVAEVEDLLESGPTRYVATGKSPTQRRKVTEPLAALEHTQPEYVERLEGSLPLIQQAYTGAMGRQIARARAARTLFEEGKPPTAGIGEGERVYRYESGDLHELDAAKDADEITAAAEGRASGEHVVLPKGQVDRLRERPQPQSGEVRRALASWNRAMGTWRGIALGTPGYVVRNAMSDLFAAYTEQGAARLARNYVRGHRTLKAQRRSERAYRWFEDEMAQAGKGKGIHVNGEFMPYRVLAAEAEAAGAIRAGRMAEITEQRRVGKGERLVKPKGQGVWRRTVERVEDQARIATYAGARERGMSPDEAAALVATAHFDYGELSKAERGSRAAFPFQTFTLRNLPRQAQLLATRPGKLAAYAHARDEAVRAVGDDLPDDYVAGQDEYEARQAGIPIRFGGHTYFVSAGLPFTDLNDLVAAKPGEPKSWATTAAMLPTTRIAQLAGPWKLPFELAFNYSTQYRQQISDPDRPHRPVPAPVAALADRSPGLRTQLGITPYQDPKTGAKTWGWDGRLDQVFRGAVPGLPGTAARATYRERGEPLISGSEIASALGVRTKRFDPQRAEINKLYRAKQPLERRAAIMRQGGVNADHSTPPYTHLLGRIKRIDDRIEAVREPQTAEPTTSTGRRLPPSPRSAAGSTRLRLPPPRR